MIRVKHPNGYEGVLHGISSMTIYNPQGKECMHTGFRTIHTAEELYKQLEGMPEFWKMIASGWDDIWNSEDEESDV